MEELTETFIVCEGYYDRAFWANGLTRLGCHDPGIGPASHRKPVLDPWGKRVAGGQFAFTSRTGAFIRIVPALGKDQVEPVARKRLGERDHRLSRLILSLDLDRPCADPGELEALVRSHVAGIASRLHPEAKVINEREIIFPDQPARIFVVPWESDPTTELPGVPQPRPRPTLRGPRGTRGARPIPCCGHCVPTPS